MSASDEISELRLDERVALITGGGRGLGYAYASLLAERGAKVAIADYGGADEGEASLAQTAAATISAEGGEAIGLAVDISTEAGAKSAVADTAEAFGALDIVVNNAGIAAGHDFDSYADEDFSEMIAVNVGGTWRVARAAWAELSRHGRGRLVNTVSRAAYMGDPQNAAYAASKGAAYGLTRALAVEGERVGIKVNAICPTAWTPLYESVADKLAEGEAERLRRDFRADLVAPAVLALVHDDCPCTGTVFAAMAGGIRRFFVSQSLGIHDSNLTAEVLLERLPEIWDATGAEEIGLVGKNRGGSTPKAEIPPAARR